MGVLLGIVVPVGNSWALFLSGGELSPVGSCPRTVTFLFIIQNVCHTKILNGRIGVLPN